MPSQAQTKERGCVATRGCQRQRRETKGQLGILGLDFIALE